MDELNNVKIYPFRLKPSKIWGIGVFARVNLKKGLKLNDYITDDSVFIKNPKDLEMARLLGVETKKGWLMPKDLSRISIWWFLNHSSRPNVIIEDREIYVTGRKIRKGEELKIDYRALSKVNNLYFV